MRYPKSFRPKGLAWSIAALSIAGVSGAAGANPVLEEVVVTAQKRAESLSDVPVSVSAVSGDKLSKAGISNMADLSEYTPNFKLVPGGLIPNVYMRGVGSGSNQGFELSVGIFADGIHLGRPHQTRAAFMDYRAGRGVARPAIHSVWQKRYRGGAKYRLRSPRSGV